MSVQVIKMAKGIIEAFWPKVRELVLYGIIGGGCAALDFGIYTMLCLAVPALVANVISVHCGIICSFFLNRHFNFKVKDKAVMRFVSFYLVGLAGLAISEGLIYVFMNKIGLDHIVSKLITVVVVAIFQFVLNKFLTFKKSYNG